MLSFKCNHVLYLYECLEVLHVISLYGALSLHNSAHLQVHFSSHVRQNYRRYCTLKIITLTYCKNYNFIYSNTTVTVTYMYLKHYLSETCVRCSSHTSLHLLSACIQVSVWSQEKRAFTLGFPLI